MGKEVYAKTKEFVLETFNFKQEEAFDRKDDLDQYVSNVNEVVLGEDYKIKVESVMLDDNILTVNSLIEFNKEQSDNYYIQGLYIKGLKIGDRDVNIEKIAGGAGPVEEVSKVQYDLFEVHLTDEDLAELKNRKTLTIIGDGLVLKENGYPRTYGEKFNITLNNLKLDGIEENTKTGDLNIKLKDENNKVDYTIIGYKFNPFRQRIFAKSNIDFNKEENKDYINSNIRLCLEGENEKGEKIRFVGHYDVDGKGNYTNNIIFVVDSFYYDVEILEENFNRMVYNSKILKLNFHIEEMGYLKKEDIYKKIKEWVELDKYEKIRKSWDKEDWKEINKILEEGPENIQDGEFEDVVRDENIGEPFTIKLK